MSASPLVLVADDEVRITKLVAIALRDDGFRVITAAGGREALRKAEEAGPDIVLLDIVMPDLDGIEVMRELRERNPVPVILLTAKGSTADKAKGLDLGADDYLAKPFHPDELAARVRAVLMDWVFERGQWQQKEANPQECVVKSGADAVECRFETKEGGVYRVTATIYDDRERRNQSELTLWVAGGKVVPRRNVEQEEINLIPDRKDYQAELVKYRAAP